MPATVELHTGLISLSSPTVTLYPDGSDTAAQSGTTATPASNRPGVYTFSNTTVTGLHLIEIISGGVQRYWGWAVLATSGTIVACDSRAEALALPNAAAGATGGLIVNSIFTEPSGVPAWASTTLMGWLAWMGALTRNKVTETATTQTLKNDADNAAIATSTVSDDATTFTRGEWS